MSGNLPVIIGVDPGSVCGWAILLPGLKDERYYLWRYGQVSPTFTTWVHSLLSSVSDKVEDRELIIAIEGQFLPKGFDRNQGFKMSQKAVIGLVLNRSRWQVIAELLGIEVIPVSPLKWQGALLGADNKTSSDERKERSKKFVKGFFGIEKPAEHETDAICLAVHEARLRLIPIARSPRPDQGERRIRKKKKKERQS